MTRGLDDGAASLAALANAMPGVAHGAVAAAADASADVLRAALGRATRGSMRLRNAGGVGVRVAVARDSASIGAVGPVGLLEGPVAPHRESAGPGGFLAGSLGHPVRGSVRHPGYRGDRVWSRAVKVAAPVAAQAGLGRAASPALIDAYREG